jgi:hypothetical protein
MLSYDLTGIPIVCSPYIEPGLVLVRDFGDGVKIYCRSIADLEAVIDEHFLRACGIAAKEYRSA